MHTFESVASFVHSISQMWLCSCRQVHQGYRGGGAVCFTANNALWSAWSDLVQSTKKDDYYEVTLAHANLEVLPNSMQTLYPDDINMDQLKK